MSFKELREALEMPTAPQDLSLEERFQRLASHASFCRRVAIASLDTLQLHEYGAIWGQAQRAFRRSATEDQAMNRSAYDAANNFQYHEPFGTQTHRYADLRQIGHGLAVHILASCPESRERSIALTKLEECVMWANASIARNEKSPITAAEDQKHHPR